jgi:uncharacterized repeat protein (TIGR01451 family)
MQLGGEVALAGEPFTCTIVVTNAGPGLPRNVVVTDTLTSSLPGTDYSVGAASFQVGTGPTSYPCGASSASGFSCDIGTVPVGGSVTITVDITPLKPGSFSNDVRYRRTQLTTLRTTMERARTWTCTSPYPLTSRRAPQRTR